MPAQPDVRRALAAPPPVALSPAGTWWCVCGTYPLLGHRSSPVAIVLHAPCCCRGQLAGHGGLPRRWTAATTAAPRTSAPAARSARAASTRVAPVVTTSSTTTTSIPGSGRTARSAPCRLRARARGVQPGLVAHGADRAQQRRGPQRRLRRGPVCQADGVVLPPRPHRRPARRHGDEHDRAGPQPVDRCAEQPAQRPHAAPIRPRSLWPSSRPRTTPSYAEPAQVRGKPGGTGSARPGAGPRRPARPGSRCTARSRARGSRRSAAAGPGRARRRRPRRARSRPAPGRRWQGGRRHAPTLPGARLRRTRDPPA